MKKPEAVLLIKQSEFKRVIDYVLSVPTGTLPGSRLAEVLNMLDNLTVVPAQAVPVLEHTLRQMSQKHPSPTEIPVPSSTPDKKPNGAEAPPAE